MSDPQVRTLRAPRYVAWVWVGSGVLYIAMGALFIFLGVTLGPHSSGIVWGVIFGIAFAALGVVWIARSLHARVELSETALTVYGYVRTRRIPREAITGFGSNGSVDWAEPNGAQRTAMIFVLGQMRPVSGSPSPLQRHFANADFDVIEKWAAKDHRLTQNW